MCILSHTFYCYKCLPLYLAFAVLWSFLFIFIFSFFLYSSLFYFLFFINSIFNFLNLLYFYTFITLSAFPTVLFPSQSLMYIHLFHLPLFNCSYLFFLVFLSFLSIYLLVLFSLLYSPLGTLL